MVAVAGAVAAVPLSRELGGPGLIGGHLISGQLTPVRVAGPGHGRPPGPGHPGAARPGQHARGTVASFAGDSQGRPGPLSPVRLGADARMIRAAGIARAEQVARAHQAKRIARAAAAAAAARAGHAAAARAAQAARAARQARAAAAARQAAARRPGPAQPVPASPGGSTVGRLTCSGSGGMLPENYATIVSFFTSHGYTGLAAAGIAGNIYQESKGDPEAVGMGGGGLIGFTPLPAGYVTGDPAADLRTQLSAILTYNEQYPQDIPVLNGASDATEAADIYMNDFERPGLPEAANREAAANAVARACGL